MAKKETESATDDVVRYCPACNQKTGHTVTLTIKDTATDHIREQNRKYARGPCRVLTCRCCKMKTSEFANR